MPTRLQESSPFFIDPELAAESVMDARTKEITHHPKVLAAMVARFDYDDTSTGNYVRASLHHEVRRYGSEILDRAKDVFVQLEQLLDD